MNTKVPAADHLVEKGSLGLAAGAESYLTFLDGWLHALPDLSCDPNRSAVLVVDMLEGFCEHGPLASPRVDALTPRVAALLQEYQQAGGAYVLLTEDSHPVDAREFASYPPHCVTGTAEARTVSGVTVQERPTWQRFPKQTINALNEPPVRAAIEQLLASGVRDFVLAGDCTDLCIYQAAMALQLLLNRREFDAYRAARVIVPERVVQTYDLPVETAAGIGAQPHPGDLLHAIFLQHMATNGITIARTVTWAR